MINRIVNWFLATFTKGYVDYPAAMQASGTSLSPNQQVVTAAATIVITSIATKLTGTTGITLVKIPTGYRGLVVIIPAGAQAFTSGGTYAGSDGTNESIPFAVTSAGAASKACLFWCDGSFLYPIVLTAAG